MPAMPQILTLLQLTGTITKKDKGLNQQVLDKLKVERERGITGTLPRCSTITSTDGKSRPQSQSADCEVALPYYLRR